MKRSLKKPRAKKVKIPKPIAPPKPDRPKRGDLRHIYKELLTTDIEQRINALSKAMAWYDSVQAYLAYKNEGKWTLKQLRMRNNAERDRGLGVKSNISETKERNYIDTIASYEIMVNGYRPPKLAPILRKLKSSKSSLVIHKKNMTKKHHKFLHLLNDALQVNIGVDRLRSPYVIGNGTLILDRMVVQNLRRLTRKHGLLSAVESLLPQLSEMVSRFPEVDNQGNKTGRYKIDYNLRYQAVLHLIHSLNQYGMRENAVRSIVRRRKSKE
jgi:hypothetical protein